MPKCQICVCLLLVFVIVNQVSGHGKLFVGLISYSGHDNRDVRGECCDPDGPADDTCWDPCDFVVQVSAFGLDGKNVTNNRLSGVPMSQSGKVEFPIPLLDKSTANPSLFTFKHWTGEVTISAQVMDLDTPEGQLQLVDEFTIPIQLTEPSQMYRCVTVSSPLRPNTRMEVALRYTCDPSYAGHDCATDCLNTPDHHMCTRRVHRREEAVTSAFLGNPLARCPLPHVTRPTIDWTHTTTSAPPHTPDDPQTTVNSHKTSPGVTSPQTDRPSPDPTQPALTSVADLDKLGTSSSPTPEQPATASTSTLSSGSKSSGLSSSSTRLIDETTQPSLSTAIHPTLATTTVVSTVTEKEHISTQTTSPPTTEVTSIDHLTTDSPTRSSVYPATTSNYLTPSVTSRIEALSSVPATSRTPPLTTTGTHHTPTQIINTVPTSKTSIAMGATSPSLTRTSMTGDYLPATSMGVTESLTPTAQSSVATPSSVTTSSPVVPGKKTSIEISRITTPSATTRSNVTADISSPEKPGHNTGIPPSRAPATSTSAGVTGRSSPSSVTSGINNETKFTSPTESTKQNQRTTSRDHREVSSMMPLRASEKTDDDDAMKYWAPIVGGCLGALALVGLVGYFVYRSKQRALIKHQEIYVVSPPMAHAIEENGTSGRSDVPMTTALL